MRWFKVLFVLLMLIGFAHAENAWRIEFEDICSKTDIAMSLTKEELASLIERCDKLRPLIESLDETTRRIYLKRLQTCKDFFIFMLESK